MNANDLPLQHERLITRFLSDTEVPFRPGQEAGPLVLEAKSSGDLPFLKTFLAANSEVVKNALYEYGAILLRGFAIESNHVFQQVLGSIAGLRPLDDYFMAEHGRSTLAGAKSVFHTNKYFKTGGGFGLGGFHSENYYSTDVPAIISFWCKEQPWIGGETALVHIANAYEELGSELHSLLQSSAMFSCLFKLSDIKKRYRISEEQLKVSLNEVGLRAPGDGGDYVAMYKPVVFHHARTGKRAIQANLSIELRELDVLLRKRFLPFYTSKIWALHRLGWKHGAIDAALSLFEIMSKLIFHPRIFIELLRHLSEKNKNKQFEKEKLQSRISVQHIEELAAAIWRHCYLLRWKRDDILIFDNLQMLHTGMPGWGKRELNVMLFNPVKLTYAPGPGLVEVSPDQACESLDSRLRALRGIVTAESMAS